MWRHGWAATALLVCSLVGGSFSWIIDIQTFAPGLIPALSLSSVDYPTIFSFGATGAGIMAASKASQLDIEYPFGQPYGPEQVYNVEKVEEYYRQRPLLVAKRLSQLSYKGFPLGLDLLVDKFVRGEDNVTIEMKKERAKELLKFVEASGAAAIKLGQAASVREDLIDPVYAQELAKLQDAVPPFSTEEAKAVYAREVGEVDEVFDTFSEAPIASASIGQVYKATKGDKTYAVKVQRPNIVNKIALDLYIARTIAPFYQKLAKSHTDFQMLTDEWGRGFIEELSYLQEAERCTEFRESMKQRGYAITSPRVSHDLSSDVVLTTDWVEGERIDKSKDGDVTEMCSLALNAYLVMLLETGVLHCDPHPGNLLKDTEGNLVILDWGMTLSVPSTLQLSLLEFISHLTSKQYDKITTDFVNLQFLKAEKEEWIRKSGFLEPLTYMLEQAGQGGGATKMKDRIYDEFRQKYPGIDDDELRVRMRADMKEYTDKARAKTVVVGGIAAKVSELQEQNMDAFTIPPWFVYTSRAFLTLEGLSLQADENFSIIKQCFPYVARRLLSDSSERAQESLKSMLYAGSSTIDDGRLEDMVEAFQAFETSTSSKKGSSPKPSEIIKEGAEILLGPKDTAVKEIVADLSADGLLGLLKLGLVQLPITPESSRKAFLSLTDEEEKATKLLAKLAKGNGGGSGSGPTLPPASLPEVVEAAKVLRKYRPGGTALAGKVASKVVRNGRKNLKQGLKRGGGIFFVEKGLDKMLNIFNL